MADDTSDAVGSEAAANGSAAGDAPSDAAPAAASMEQLAGHIEEIERLLTERADLAATIRLAWAAAKSAGFDRRGITHVITQRALDPAERLDRAAIATTYAAAMGLEVETAGDLVAVLHARASQALAAHAEAAAAGALGKRKKRRAADERALREMARGAGVLPAGARLN